ncbi:YggS family pyridoxal phosphate-dependent enzyme [Cnuella takakiae]|nr:YggS family pyridoxal phosphate-dependent enzyme [Cnuella takakiae]OLY92884.1 YggS family pyridoxal phosphate enzyme [Cnuella takakiae]
MAINTTNFETIRKELEKFNATLVAVSKTKPVSDIEALYALGQRDFGENYVQELVEKQPLLPGDIRWHFIGHLQTNKVKYIAPFVYLIHGVDSYKLLREINKQGAKINRVIDVLLQVHIASEETKFGFDAAELEQLCKPEVLSELTHVRIRGMMGMASFTENKEQVIQEFGVVQDLFQQYQNAGLPALEMEIRSMGMSNDYPLALEQGSNMVRIGSLLFGARNYGTTAG